MNTSNDAGRRSTAKDFDESFAHDKDLDSSHLSMQTEDLRASSGNILPPDDDDDEFEQHNSSNRRGSMSRRRPKPQQVQVNKKEGESCGDKACCLLF